MCNNFALGAGDLQIATRPLDAIAAEILCNPQLASPQTKNHPTDRWGQGTTNGFGWPMSKSGPVKSEGFTALNHHIGHVEVLLPLQLHMPVEMMIAGFAETGLGSSSHQPLDWRRCESNAIGPCTNTIPSYAPAWSLAMAPAQHECICLHLRNTIESVLQGPGVNIGSWALKKRTRTRWTLGRLHTIFQVTFPLAVETRHPSVNFLVSDLHCSWSDWSTFAT